jgi:hypothetical protein
MQPRATACAALLTLVLAVLIGCSGTGFVRTEAETTGSDVSGSESCAPVIRYAGAIYEGLAVAVAPLEGRPLGVALLPGCADGGGASSGEQVEVAELSGVSPDVALVWRGRNDAVFIRRGATPPRAVEDLLRPPACESRDEPIELSGPWLGILGADGNTEVDLKPPYDIELFVASTSAARYERAFLTVRVPPSLGEPLTREDVKSSLWKGGTVSMRVRCGDGGVFVAETIAAAPPT